MQEQRLHMEAFDFYYKIGATRSLSKVAEEFGKSNATIKRWSSLFNWRERVEERDRELGAQMIKQTDKEILNEHEIKNKVRSLLWEKSLQDVEDGEIKVRNIADLERLAKMDLSLQVDDPDGEDGDNMQSLIEVLERSFLSLKDATVRPD